MVCRFRMLAEHFRTMYPNLNVDIDSELQQLKVRSAYHVEVFHGVIWLRCWCWAYITRGKITGVKVNDG